MNKDETSQHTLFPSISTPPKQVLTDTNACIIKNMSK